MVTTSHLKQSARNLLLSLAIASIAFVSCSKQLPEQSNDLLQGFPPDMVRFLTLEDDSSRARHGREAGIVSLNSYLMPLYKKLNDLPPDCYDRDAPILVDYLFRVTRVMRSEYQYEYPFDELTFIQSLPSSIQQEIYSLRRGERDIFWSSSQVFEYENDISRIEEIKDRLVQLGDTVYVPIADFHISDLYSRLGDEDKSVAKLRNAVRGFDENGQAIMLCQGLGVLGSHYEKIGEIDSMIMCFEKALSLSKRIRHPNQAGRISNFYAGYYIREGRLGLGHELLYEAMECCRQYKGGALETRFICSTMDFYADLECWDLVSDLLDRVNILERLYADDRALYYYRMDIHGKRVDEIEARFEMSRGNVDRADAIFARVKDTGVSEPHAADQAKIYYHWARGLADNGRLRRAEAICREGAEYANEFRIRDWEAKLILLEARLQYLKGNMVEAESKLRQFAVMAADFEDSLYEEIMFGDLLMGRMKLESGDIEKAFSHLISGLDELVYYITTRDASAHSYLLFEKFEGLKDLFHDLVAYSPSLGYGVEMYWRRFNRDLGMVSCRSGDSSSRVPIKGESGIPSLERSEDIVDSVRVLSEKVLARITEQGAVHCAYAVHGDEVWRWVASSGRIERETLDMTEDGLREIISGTLEMMTAAPGDEHLSIPSELTERLRMLANIMLPEEMLGPSDEDFQGPLYISAGGFLGLVPFEAYNIGGRGEYVPLLEHHDVVYLRHADFGSSRGDCQRGVVLVNTEPVTTVRNRRFFTEHLAEIMSEGDIMAEADANALKLVGKEATKANLLGLWEGASYLYFATHIFRDSEVPYLVHIPLAVPEGESEISMRYLDTTDIHAAEFSSCRLVVLSGCSSGVPYCGSITAGPALGDIFIDAGVEAVVHTNWSVEDASARNLMGSFIRSWCEEGMSPSDALCRVRRNAMRDDSGFRHPLLWASYSIKTGSLQ
jgi:tetratricopeptide (TPR) repeat protein